MKLSKHDRTVRNAARSRVKLSETSKLGCLSWSLAAFETCPGRVRDADGAVVDACAGCYARGGFYAMPGAIAVRDFNREDWQRNGWIIDMRDALIGETEFRWFDSGDMYSVSLAKRIYEVMTLTPWVRHWLPTRMHKFAKYIEVIDAMRALPNVVVRASSDSVKGETVKGQSHHSTIVPTPDTAPTNAVVCKAYARGGKCGDCRDCWSKDVEVIAYPAHGMRMAKVIHLSVAA